MKFHRAISKIDFALQTLAMLFFFVSLIAFDKYVFFCLFSVAAVQAFSIIYYSCILKRNFDKKRKTHYNLTTITLILLFLVYFILFSEIQIDIAIIFVLVIIGNASIMLTIYYYLITLFEMVDQKKTLINVR